jgi:hypothetical protein
MIIPIIRSIIIPKLHPHQQAEITPLQACIFSTGDHGITEMILYYFLSQGNYCIFSTFMQFAENLRHLVAAN